MTRYLGFGLRHVAFGLLLATVGLAQDVSRMDEVVQYNVSNKKFMGSVLVARSEEILLNKGYGSANLEWNISNSPATKFRLGSVTKQFTAAAILLLEERGKLKTDDPVKKFMSDAPTAWEKITIYHLLTHTSGIPNFTSFPDYPSQKPFAATPEKLVARFRDKPLDFQPGEKRSYSNSGYILLGYVLEKASGESYEKFLRENIFASLGGVRPGDNARRQPAGLTGYWPDQDPVVCGVGNEVFPQGDGRRDRIPQGQQGTVTHLMLRQGAMETKAPRK
jgi:CubicO group peptidase (beta-lactamase class C family)